MVVSQNDFRDEELFDTKKVLEDFGLEVKVAAPKKNMATGKLGGIIEPDLSIDEISELFFDALVLIGGPGAFNFIEDKDLHDLIKKFVQEKKTVGAICIAPAILAKAGVLTKKKATVHSSGINYLEQEKVNYTDQDVVEDENIVTANGPAASSIFGQTIIKNLKI